MQIKETKETKGLAENPASVAYYIEGAGAPLLTNGPLSASISQALDQIYKREIDPTTSIVLETQQLDQSKKVMWAETVEAFNLEHDEPPAMLYGVAEQQANASDLIDVTRAIGRMSPLERTSSVVVVEGGQDSTKPTVVALEALCSRSGVAFYSSFSAFVKSR